MEANWTISTESRNINPLELSWNLRQNRGIELDTGRDWQPRDNYGLDESRTHGFDANNLPETLLLSGGYLQVVDNMVGITNWRERHGRTIGPNSTLHPIQEWEGYVVEIGEMEFSARLMDLTAGHSYETEEAVIPLDEISDDDHAKIREGSIFRWVIGHERFKTGTKRRVSQIVFRDLPAMTESDFSSGSEWASRIARSFRE